MELFTTIALFIVGLIFIVKGGDWFVDAASWLAEATGVPRFIIGATIVSLATTLPEILVSTMATAEGKVDMAIGNAVGSVTANTAMILAISILCMPGMVQRSQYASKGIMLIAATAALWALCSGGGLAVLPSLVLLAIFLVFMGDNVIKGKRAMSADTEVRPAMTRKVIIKNVALFVIGAAGIIIGAQLLVNNGSELARIMGVPENIIGLTFVAIGTSLPELVTTITAIVKKQASLSVGNIIGANLIDIALILPVCSMLSGGTLAVNSQAIALDLPVCLLVICIAIIPALIMGSFKRWQGLALLVCYGAYIVVMV